MTLDALVPDVTVLPRDLQLLVRYARTMDSGLRVPGIGIHIGADALLGVVPVVGDALSALVSLAVLSVAFRHRVPRPLLLRMVTRTALDFGVGSVPVIGDIFDVAYRDKIANVRAILEHHLASPASATNVLAMQQEIPA
jgi:hypothetical protein